MTHYSADYFIHAANILLLVAYSVRDILWLRLFAVGASVVSIPYFLLQPATLWAPFGWTVVFAGINLLQSWRLFMERRPVKLTAEEEEVRRLLFKDLPPRKVLQVLSIGSWVTAERGERLIRSGTVPDAVTLIVRGKVRVAKDEQVIGALEPGQLVGSALILSGVQADVEAVVESPVRGMRWQVGTLERYLDANPDTRAAMQRHLARDLAKKVEDLA
ncbi:MAG TPA: cyclic nucleotide-binding domain-containing protein [Burkholderiales bacterium]|nr:cyclic nucleotide-binding domain-containing protein [Burkholderiales bacterium]